MSYLVTLQGLNVVLLLNFSLIKDMLLTGEKVEIILRDIKKQAKTIKF